MTLHAPPRTKPAADHVKVAPNAGSTAMAPIDRSAEIAQRAYTFYQQGGSHDGHAAQDWQRAEVRRNDPPVKRDTARIR